jgi:hypothetical protein
MDGVWVLATNRFLIARRVAVSRLHRNCDLFQLASSGTQRVFIASWNRECTPGFSCRDAEVPGKLDQEIPAASLHDLRSLDESVYSPGGLLGWRLARQSRRPFN